MTGILVTFGSACAGLVVFAAIWFAVETVGSIMVNGGLPVRVRCPVCGQRNKLDHDRIARLFLRPGQEVCSSCATGLDPTFHEHPKVRRLAKLRQEANQRRVHE